MRVELGLRTADRLEEVCIARATEDLAPGFNRVLMLLWPEAPGEEDVAPGLSRVLKLLWPEAPEEEEGLRRKREHPLNAASMSICASGDLLAQARL